MIKFPAGISYNSERPPFKKEVGKSVESKPSTQVSAVVTIIQLIEINEADSTFDLFFKIQLKWSDNNIKYSFLKNDPDLNKINSNWTKQIWRPNIKFYLVSENKDEDFEDNLLVWRQSEPKVYQDPESEEKNVGLTTDEIYDGETNQLELKMERRKLFTCSFDEISNFPFGEQICQFTFFIEGSSNKLTNLSAERLIESHGKSVGEYRVRAWEMKESYFSATDMKGITVSMKLYRNLQSVFMVTYLPTILMNIINQATNYISSQNKVRFYINFPDPDFEY